MRVLVVHNRYQHRGGEDSVVEAEITLLQSHGHEVVTYARDNQEITKRSQLAVARDTIWSRRTTSEIGELIRNARPTVVHTHNTFPLVSPAVYWAAHRAGIPVVQTLHNFRLMCPQAMLLRDGKVCEECAGRVPWRAVRYRCYRGSTAQSSVLATMLTLHRAAGTYANKVTRYIALNDFCRRKFIEGGLPADRIVIKPNFVDVPCTNPPGRRRGGLFVGRLSPEKGTQTLAAAATHLDHTIVDVIGIGDEREALSSCQNLNLLGWQSGAEILERMRRAAYLVMPSIWYENFPRTLVEAFACGLPVIASRIGALAEIVKDEVTGLLFEPGNPQDLADKVHWAEAHPDTLARMGEAARTEYEEKYTAERNYETLMRIYGEACQDVHG